MPEKKTMHSVHLEVAQHAALRALSEATSIPMAVYIRQGVDAVIKANAAVLSMAAKPDDA